jgi:hypothetical protein
MSALPALHYPRRVSREEGATVRALRAVTATLAVLGLSAAAHEMGGGHAPGLMALTVLGLLLGPALWIVTRHRLGHITLFALLGCAQVVSHASLVAMAPTRGSGQAVHVHGGLPVPLATDTAEPIGSMGGSVVPGPSMLLMHVAATFALTVLLTHLDVLVEVLTRCLVPVTRAALGATAGAAQPAAWSFDRLTGVPVRPLGGRAPPVAPA